MLLQFSVRPKREINVKEVDFGHEFMIRGKIVMGKMEYKTVPLLCQLLDGFGQFVIRWGDVGNF